MAYVRVFLLLILQLAVEISTLPSHSFRATVLQPFFVDKSALLRLFFDENITSSNESPYYYITAPRHFGKSVNLDMIHQFAALILDEVGNPKPPEGTPIYELFDKLEIGRHPQVMKYLGRYPVIHLDLMGLAMPDPSMERFCSDFNIILWYELQQYPNLKDLREYPNKYNLSEYETEFLKKLQNKTLTLAELDSALTNLAKILHDVYGEKVVLLLHEYDETAFTSYISIKSQVTDVYRALNDAVHKTLTLGRSYIAFALIHCVTTLPYAIYLPFQETFKHYAFLDDHEFAKFYGITESELVQLFDRYDCTDAERRAFWNFYRGFRLAGKNEVMYSMSAAFYFRDRMDNASEPFVTRNYFKKCDYATRLSLFTKNTEFREIIEKLLSQGSVEINVTKCSGSTALRNLEVLRDRRWVGTLPHHTEMFLTHVFELGYISHGVKNGTFVVPSIERKEVVQENIDIYYRLYVT